MNGVAGRIRDLEARVGGTYYVGLCWLAIARDSGKGAKRRLEDKVFGTDKPKVTSTFRNARSIADKAFAGGSARPPQDGAGNGAGRRHQVRDGMP